MPGLVCNAGSSQLLARDGARVQGLGMPMVRLCMHCKQGVFDTRLQPSRTVQRDTSTHNVWKESGACHRNSGVSSTLQHSMQ
jgi:hypothetical protein